MLIKNYGLFWEKNSVYWGGRRPDGAGCLLGSTKKRNAPEVNFRNQKGIYTLHRGGRIVYIGQTGMGEDGLFERLRAHTQNHLAGRWDMFSWFGLVEVDKAGQLLKNGLETQEISMTLALDHFEAILLSTIEPVLNKQGPRWGDGVQRYYQRRHEDLDYTDRELQEEIFGLLLEISTTIEMNEGQLDENDHLLCP